MMARDANGNLNQCGFGTNDRHIRYAMQTTVTIEHSDAQDMSGLRSECARAM